MPGFFKTLEKLSAKRRLQSLRMKYLWREAVSFMAATTWLDQQHYRWNHEYAKWLSSVELQELWDEVFKEDKHGKG